jgi:hypothetical protein
MRTLFFTSSDEQESSNLFAWSIGFTFAFIITVGLIMWLLQQKKVERATYIKIREPEKFEEPPPLEPDDLTKIEGIGPKINAVLQEANLSTYTQLAKTEVSQLREVLSQAGLSRFNPETWPEQAALAANNDWDGLSILQEELQGGRRA